MELGVDKRRMSCFLPDKDGDILSLEIFIVLFCVAGLSLMGVSFNLHGLSAR